MKRGMVSDAELISRWKSGNDAALEMLLRRHESALYGYLFRMLNSRHDAEDAAQEAFIRAVKGLRSSYRERGQFKCWLYRIAYREGLRIIRRRGSGITVEALDEAITERLEDPTPKAPGQLARREEKALLERAIGELPESERQVVMLRVNSELSFREIANVMGCPLNTALGRMHNATKRLRKLMKEQISESH